MKLKEFIRQLKLCADEMGSHPKLDDSLEFLLDTEDGYDTLELVEVDAKQTFGCRCIYGASVILKKKDNE